MQVAAFAVVAATVLACGPKDGAGDGGDGDGGAGLAKACDLKESKAPYRVPGRGKGQIHAAVHAVCDVPPQTHILTVWLEREGSDGKEFFQVGQTQRYTEIPGPGGRIFTIEFPGCVDGLWRVRARAEGIGPNGKPFTFALPVEESRIRVIKCS